MDVRGVDVSDPDKVFFPDSGITKGEIAEYYGRIGDTMLPHVRGRCISMHRWPDGIEGEDFYQKDAPDYFPDWIRTETVSKKGGGSVRHVVADDAETLVYLANQGCLTPHVWLSRVDSLNDPDRMVFDLDPPDDEDASLDDVRWAARRIRDLLDELGASSRVMTSGSRGLHVYLALDRSATFDTARAFASDVCELLARRHPDRLTTAQRKKKREGRIFLDYLRNGYAQTSVPAYAVRAKPGAPVATPIEWDEVGGIRPRRYTVRNLFKRLGQKSDPWEDIDDAATDLESARDRLDEIRQEEIGEAGESER